MTLTLTGCWSAGHSAGPAINDEVRDGSFGFTVATINIGIPKTGNRTAQGTFVVVNLMVRNVGKAPRPVYCQNQTLRDFAGKRYDTAVNLESPQDRVTIEPGYQVRIACAFDVPEGTLPAAIELRDSPYTRGVRVALLARR